MFDVDVDANKPVSVSVSFLESMPLSCTVFEILTLISQMFKTSRDLNHAHLADSWSVASPGFGARGDTRATSLLLQNTQYWTNNHQILWSSI